MEFQIEGLCVVTLEHKVGEKTSSHVATDFNLDVSNNLDKSQYLDSEGVPTASGTKALTQCFVQGLIGNIHQAHQKEYWDSAEHLRYIISELERGFVQVADTYNSNFKS